MSHLLTNASRSTADDLPPGVTDDHTSRGPRGKLAPAGRLLGSKAALSVLDQAVVSGTNFATCVIIGRTCSQHDLGVYALAMSLLVFVMGLQAELVAAPYTVYWRRREADSRAAFAGSVWVHQSLLSLLGVVLLLGLIGWLSLTRGSTGLCAALWVLVAAAPFLWMRMFIRMFAFAHLSMRLVLVMDLSVAALQLTALLVLARYGVLNVPVVLAVLGVIYAAATACWWFTRRLPIRFVKAQILPDWYGNWKFARWALATLLLGCSTPFLLPWLLALVQGEAATGVFAACSTVTGLSYTFVTGICHYLSPRAVGALTEEGPEAMQRILRAAALVFLACVGLFCLVVVATGDWLVVLFYGVEYAGCGPLTAVLACAVLANSIGVVAGQGVCALDRPQANLVADIVTMAVTMMLAGCLIPPFGALGAAAAMLGGTVGGTLVRWGTLSVLLREAIRPVIVASGGAANVS